MTTQPDDHVTDLDLHPNEASGLVRVHDTRLLEHFGWDKSFWSVLDEVDICDGIVLIGHDDEAARDEGWQPERLQAVRRGTDTEVKDAEAVAYWGGMVYVFGSHHGGKSGPIRREEQWIARFDESAVVGGADTGPGVDLEIVDTGFRLHRLLNDALRDSRVDVVPMEDLTRRSFLDETIEELAGTDAEGLVDAGDWTVNIEGAEFTADGRMLLGLRFPVTAEGLPLVVVLREWERLFGDRAGLPEVEAIVPIDAVGRNGSMAGVRDLCVLNDELHVVTGDLDSAGKGSVIRKDYPGGNDTVSTHFVTSLGGGDGPRPATVVKEFPDNPRIEGIAADGHSEFFYVSDEDDAISMRSTPLLSTRR